MLIQSCEQQNWTVAHVFRRGVLGLTFNRSFTHLECVEWEGLGRLLENFVLTPGEDVAFWKLEANSKFSSRFLYRFILNPGVKDMMDMWKTKCPLKQKIFYECVLEVKFSWRLVCLLKVGLGMFPVSVVVLWRMLTTSFFGVQLQFLFGVFCGRFSGKVRVLPAEMSSLIFS
jgi:hypothetical protein